MTARDYRTTRLALAEGATEGLWKRFTHEPGIVFASPTGNYIVANANTQTAAPGEPEQNAAFIADARASNPAMAAALIAVLDLHKQSPNVFVSPEGDYSVCRACSSHYPCPTVRLINELGADK